MSLFEWVSDRTWGVRGGQGRYLSIGTHRWLLSSSTILLLVALAVAMLFLLVPAYLLVRAGSAGAATVNTLLSERTWVTLGNTLALTIAVVLSTAAISLPLAWLVTSTDLPGKRMWRVLAALPLVIPSYVAAYLFVSLFSPKGLVQGLLEPLLGMERFPPIYGFFGAWLVLTLITYPFTYLAVCAGLQRIDPSLIEAGRSLGLSPRRAFWRITVPMLKPSLTTGSLLVALYCLRDFGAVNLLRYGTFTRVIYNRYQVYRLDEAAAMALFLVALTATFLYLDHLSRGRERYERLSAGAARVRPSARLGIWKGPALIFVALIVCMALIVPAGGLGYWLWRGLSQDWLKGDMGLGINNVAPLIDLIRPAWNSLAVAFGAALLTVTLAIPIAVLAVRKPGRLTRLLERITFTGSALPGIVVALAFVFIGINFARSFYQTLPMLLAAYVILFLPQAVGSERASLLQVSPRLEEAGRSLGRRPHVVFRRVTLPLVRPGLLAAGTMVFLTAMKELPATLILSPSGFDTLAVQVWANISEAFFARAAVPTLLLILLSSVPLAFFMLRNDNSR